MDERKALTEEPAGGFSPRRVARTAIVVTAVGAVAWGLYRSSWMSALSLTAAGAVAIINFRWLELVLARVVHPGAPQFDRGSAARIFGRLALFGVVVAGLFWVPGVDFVGVALGFSALVGAVVFEALRPEHRGGG